MSALSVALPTRRATSQLAQRLAPALRAGDLVVLDGPLGSGKTFFVRALCRALGLPASERVTSPTFILVQELETRLAVSHADLYRLGSLDEVRALGLDAARDEGRVVVVEWGSPYLDLLGGDGLIIELQMDPRCARISATGTRSLEIVEALGPSSENATAD